jgi:hypothetical protein
MREPAAAPLAMAAHSSVRPISALRASMGLVCEHIRAASEGPSRRASAIYFPKVLRSCTELAAPSTTSMVRSKRAPTATLTFEERRAREKVR